MTDLQKLAGALYQLMPVQTNPADLVDLTQLDNLDKEFYLVQVTFQLRNATTPTSKTLEVRKAYFNLFGVGSIANKVMRDCQVSV